MFHTGHDVAVFMSEVLLLLGGFLTAVYAVVITIALVDKAFSSLRALCTSTVVSVIATIPFVGALVLRWPEVPKLFDDTDVLPPINAALLCFVWLGPLIQYVWLSTRSSAGQGASRESLGPDENKTAS